MELGEVELTATLLSLKVAFWSTLVTLPIAIFLAWLLSRKQFPGKMLLDCVVHLPLVLPPVVVGYGLLLLFGSKGILGSLLQQYLGITIIFTWKGAALASAVMALPLFVRAIRVSFDAADQRLEAAARCLGAARWWVFLSVTLPLAMPGIIAGTILGFARSLSEFGATITFVSNIPGETQTLPLAIESLIQMPDGEAGAMRLTIISIIIAFGALILAHRVNLWLMRRGQDMR
ncbi:molybdate ABC transporter permease subunit [Dongia soli]|uniref:Molybdenum transport system permease n=1 Tax=Dongia soli TaxID=600628 RepID=A0ABU5EHV2_9PROT|nr:molybdate ABC transporter permease subunit [Dongia soli]MDY0885018.1 molybdate ABC transporter permease subunit [Dongia soli]